MLGRLTARHLAVAFWGFTGVSMLLSTAAYQAVGTATLLEFVATILGAGILTLWYERDAREHDAYRHGFALLVFFLAIIAVPIHLVRSRGWRGAGRSGLVIVGAALLTVALTMVAEWALFGIPLF